jgi:two-component system nitrate/nitrite response regulator NarL
MTKVAVADDHPLFNEGISRALRDSHGLTLVGSVTDGEAALALVRARPTDVLLLDLDMPRMSGLEVIKQLGVLQLPTRVLVVTGSIVLADAYNALHEGAKGYLLKTTDWDDIATGIRRIAGGGTCIDHDCAEALAQRTTIGRTVLTEREREVLQAVATHPSYKEAGRALGVRDRAVESAMRRISKKLGVTSKSSAIMEGIRLGIVRPNG